MIYISPSLLSTSPHPLPPFNINMRAKNVQLKMKTALTWTLPKRCFKSDGFIAADNLVHQGNKVSLHVVNIGLLTHWNMMGNHN